MLSCCYLLAFGQAIVTGDETSPEGCDFPRLVDLRLIMYLLSSRKGIKAELNLVLGCHYSSGA